MGKDPEKDYSAFNTWLQCYYKDGMQNLVDHNGRTMWFSGPPGPMIPTNSKSRGKRTSKKKENQLETDDHDYSPKKAKKAAKGSKKAANGSIKEEDSSVEADIQPVKTENGTKKAANSSKKAANSSKKAANGSKKAANGSVKAENSSVEA